MCGTGREGGAVAVAAQLQEAEACLQQLEECFRVLFPGIGSSRVGTDDARSDRTLSASAEQQYAEEQDDEEEEDEEDRSTDDGTSRAVPLEGEVLLQAGVHIAYIIQYDVLYTAHEESLCI